MDIFGQVVTLIQSGLANLAAYLAAHVLLCLVPAFFIAGGLSTLVPKESVTRFLGRSAPKYVAYPAAALAGSVLAVCSCTILPLFAGVYKKGAGLGPAITFLFFAPAANILALAYTGVALGAEFVIARLVLSLLFGIGIGLIMALMFHRDDLVHSRTADTVFAGGTGISAATGAFLIMMVVLLLAGTLKIGVLTASYFHFTIPVGGLAHLQETLARLVPADPTRGVEGVTAQGAILIGLLILVGLTAWRGLGRLSEGFNRWTPVALALVGVTLIVAAVGIQPGANGVGITLTGKTLAVTLSMIAILSIARRHLEREAVRQWLTETWRFVLQILPLLLVGVFAVGIVRHLIRPEWIEALAGSNSLAGNLAAVLFGVFMYFPTLVEVPVAQMFLHLGMHKGPLIAYLMADPELSLQSILITAAIIGRAKALTYVGWVAIFSTTAGLLYGAWTDGAGAGRLAGYLCLIALALTVVLLVVRRHVRVTAERIEV